MAETNDRSAAPAAAPADTPAGAPESGWARLRRQAVANGGWWGGGLAVGVAAALVATGFGGRGLPADDAALKQLVRQAILDDPDIIPEAINLLQQKEVTKLLASNRQAIETPFAGAWAGAENGDVVLVEFFDFNCPFCRQSAPDVERLIQEDKGLKVVFRDMPVLGPESERFALASLSAAQQGKYRQFYQTVFEGQGGLSEERLIKSVRAAGMDEQQVSDALHSAALENEVKGNLALGRALGLTGTPSYVIGDQILSGAVGYEALKQAVEEARARPA